MKLYLINNVFLLNYSILFSEILMPTGILI